MVAKAGVVVGQTVTAFVNERASLVSRARNPSGHARACAKALSARRQSTVRKRIEDPTFQGYALDVAAPRLTVVGLDAVTFDVIDPLVLQGELPNLARLFSSG